MQTHAKKAILVVSFGTSFEDTRKKTIDAIVQDVRDSYPDLRVCEAWTSRIIMRKIRERDHMIRLSVCEALEQLKSEGVTDVRIQPTHIINGIETERLTADALQFQHDFDSLKIGAPLLTSHDDLVRMVEILSDEYRHIPSDTALVLMGHGTEHYVNTVYAALDYLCKDMGHPNFFIGTVEAYPSLDTLMNQVRESGFSKVTLAPLMIVAGDHAANDLVGQHEDSWLSRFTRAGYETSCIIKGLGEFAPVRKLLLQHISDMENSDA